MPDSAPPAPPVSIALRQLGIPHRVFVHPGPIASLEQAALERGQRPSQVVRSIVFRLGAERHAMVLMAGPDQVSWKALRAAFGQSRMTMASEDEVLAVTGYRTGTVSPIGIPADVPVFVDESVLAEAEVSIGSGVRSTTVILSTADLMRAIPAATIGQYRGGA